MFCTNCGKENVDGAMFCSSCGKQLTSNVVNTTANANIHEVNTGSIQSTPVAPTIPPKKKKPVALVVTIIVALVVIIIVALAGGLIWFITGNDDSSSDSNMFSSLNNYKEDDYDDSDYIKHEHLAGNEDEKAKEEIKAEILSKYFGKYTLEKVNSNLNIDPPQMFRFWKDGFITADVNAGVYANNYTIELDIETLGNKEYIVKSAQNDCKTDFRFYVNGSTMYLEVVSGSEWVDWAEYSFEAR